MMTTEVVPNSVTCEFQHDQTVNFAVQQNHVPIIKRLRVLNSGPASFTSLVVKLSVSPEFALAWETTIDALPSGETVDLGTVDLQLSSSFLATLTERMAGTLTVTVTTDDQTLTTINSPIDVLAFDEWNGTQTLPEIIAAFVMPNHPEVTRVLSKASDVLKDWTGDPSLDGYQRKDTDRVRLQMAAIYAVLQDQQIAYCVPPASFEEQGQKVRTPDVIRESRLGTCLDLAVLYAACVEAAGLHPILVFTKGHAFVGSWLVEETFAESVQDDITLLTKRIAPGIGEMCMLEATALTAGKDMSFEQAVAAGEANLRIPEHFHFFVDIRRARMSRIRPLPLRVNGQVMAEGDEERGGGVPSFVHDAPSSGEMPIDVTADSNATNARTRLEEWERRLLDLTLRNPLLNFRVTSACVPLLTSALYELEDKLADGEDFQVHPRPQDWEGTPRDATVFQRRAKSDPQVQLLHDEFSQRRLRADLPERDLSNRLTGLYRAARTSLEESGANTFFLSLGMLVWYETETSQKPRFAPILLIPMDIVRKSVQMGYLVRQGEDEPQLNITLLEMLKQDFGIEIKGLDPLPTDASGIDVKKVLTIIRRAIMHKAKWDVIEDAYLGLFSFSKFVMWHDLKARAEELKRNKVVASLMAGSLQWTPSDDCIPEDRLDHEYRPHDLCCPISADSSQLAAISRAGSGQSIVLHGPPGTGKSQTITNLIAHALAQGKSVLFVAEKMAALTVVQRRLAQINLAPFCLEVHSNKSKKKEVLEQLRLSLDTARVVKPQTWENEANRLARLRDELNAYVEALHRPRQIGHSIFQGIARLTAVQQAPVAVTFSTEQVAGLTPDRLQGWQEAVRLLRVAGEACGHPHGHPWVASQRQDYTPQIRTQAAEALATLRLALDHWQQTVPPVAKLFRGIEQEESYRDLSALVEVAKRFLAAPSIPGSLVNVQDWDDARIAVDTWVAHGHTRDALRSEVFARYTERVLGLDVASLRDGLAQTEGKWIFPRWLGRLRISKALRGTLKSGVSLDNNNLDAELQQLQRLQEEEKVLTNASDRARILLGRVWADGQADWDAVTNACRWAGEIRKLAGIIAGTDLTRAAVLRDHWAQMLTEYRDQLNPEDTLGRQLQAFTEASTAVTSAWQSLSHLLNLAQTALVDDQLAPGWFGRLQERVTRWESSLDLLRDWCTWIRTREQAVREGLQPLVTAYENGQLQHSDVESAFVRGLYQAWVEHEIAGEPVLVSFARGLFEDKIQQFRKLDDEFAELTRQEIYARLAARIPRSAGEAAQSSEMGVLQRELLKQRNHMALRTLFQKIPNLLTKLKPCFLMSPMSVAQYLDPSHPPFDLVIFDEASQVPTCDAVGAIARGTEVAIVGDPKQLPPTSFFATTSTGDDDAESLQIEDLESILDDCLALRMPEAHLQWHYRSQHESLIAFSNYQYYDNRLLTFPSPDDLSPAVRWCPVKGIYDRGKSKQNRAEAEAVVAEIVQRLCDPELCRSSIGVVTFSQVQQKLIEDMLDEQRRQVPELEPYFSPDMVEPVFVKNLENVQGDERDVILFSVGYGPDAQGIVSMNFGPLNREGGWRRLNVAISRARQEMMVFSTLRADHLDTSRTSAKGVADLKAFLEYAEHGKGALSAQRIITGREEESLFEEQVCQALRERGHSVHTQVGCSGYRIDLAVVHPEYPGRYLLGIECDGATYHRAKTARDRDKLREAVLRKLGWQIHRIWSTDWWENPQRELERIQEAIAAAEVISPEPRRIPSVAESPVERVASSVISAPPAAPTVESEANAVTYTAYRLDVVAKPSEEFYQPSSDRIIVRQIDQVISAEGPISFNLLCRRVIAAWGMAQVGSRIRARLQDVCNAQHLTTTKRGTTVFYWPKGVSPQQYEKFRIPGDRRDAEDLSSEEIANAALEVLLSQVSLPEDDLIREVAHHFGYARTGKSIEECLQSGIRLLIQQGRARQEDDGRIVQI